MFGLKSLLHMQNHTLKWHVSSLGVSGNLQILEQFRFVQIGARVTESIRFRVCGDGRMVEESAFCYL